MAQLIRTLSEANLMNGLVVGFLISLRIQSKCGKMRTRKASNTDTFHAVEDIEIKLHLLVLKPLLEKWLVNLYNYLTLQKVQEVSEHGWKSAGGITEVISVAYPRLSQYHICF